MHPAHEPVVEETGEPLGKGESDVHDAGNDREVGGFSLARGDEDGELEERDIGDHEKEFAEGRLEKKELGHGTQTAGGGPRVGETGAREEPAEEAVEEIDGKSGQGSEVSEEGIGSHGFTEEGASDEEVAEGETGAEDHGDEENFFELDFVEEFDGEDDTEDGAELGEGVDVAEGFFVDTEVVTDVEKHAAAGVGIDAPEQDEEDG